ncbi:MAG: histidine phosphatase family protein [Acidimicrobiia bacterium]|nr:histidine phosphatase family protein [Acidimicrobiia bacterium]
MDLYFVRHGEPAWIVDGINHADPHLSERGRRQAELTAQRLAALDPPITEILVSPAVRSQETAAPIAKAAGLNPVTLDGLLEIKMPDWDGRPGEEVERLFREARKRPAEEWWAGLEGGESFGDFHERIVTTLTTELGERGVHPKDAGHMHLWTASDAEARIAVVAHAGTNSVALGWLLDVIPAPWEWERFVLGHCSLARIKSVAIAGANVFSLRSFNDQEHMPEELRTR